jgi:hypothetical protein
VESGVELHIGMPLNINSNSNQYFVHFDGLNDYKRNPSTIVIIGDWEYQEFCNCLSLASAYMEEGAPNLNKTFRSKERGLDIVTLELTRKSDKPNKVRIKFTFEEQVPLVNGASWKGITQKEFAFYLSIDELKRLGQVTSRFSDGEYTNEVVLESDREDWACPVDLSHPKEVVTLDRLLESAVQYVKTTAPKGIQPAWTDLLKKVCYHGTTIGTCTSCKGLFSRDFLWKKQCYGCYYNEKPTALHATEANKVTISNWLTSIENEMD